MNLNKKSWEALWLRIKPAYGSDLRRWVSLRREALCWRGGVAYDKGKIKELKEELKEKTNPAEEQD